MTGPHVMAQALHSHRTRLMPAIPAFGWQKQDSFRLLPASAIGVSHTCTCKTLHVSMLSFLAGTDRHCQPHTPALKLLHLDCVDQCALICNSCVRSDLSRDSAKVQSAVDLVLDYERKSDAVLVHLLGRSYSLSDAVFYGLGSLAAFSAGSMPCIRQARLPLLALLGGSLTLERCSLHWLHGMLEADSAGRVCLWLMISQNQHSASEAQHRA